MRTVINAALLLAFAQAVQGTDKAPLIFPPSAITAAGETQEEVASRVINNGDDVRVHPDLLEKYRPVLVPQTKQTSCSLAVIHSCLRSKGMGVSQAELTESEIARWNLWLGMPIEVIPKYLEHALKYPLSLHKISSSTPSVWNEATAGAFLQEVRRRLSYSEFAFISIQVGPLRRHALRLLEITDEGELIVLNPIYAANFDLSEDLVDKSLLIQKWPARWLRQPLMADIYFAKPAGIARILSGSERWESAPTKFKQVFSSSDYLVRPGGVPHAYVAKAILELDRKPKEIDVIMAAKKVPSHDSGWNWFYYLQDILTELSGKRFARSYLISMDGSVYAGKQRHFLRDLRERMRGHDYCTLEMQSEDGERVVLVLDVDSSRGALNVYVAEESVGQNPLDSLVTIPVEDLLAANVKLEFYKKQR
jgi:hypothetical protein